MIEGDQEKAYEQFLAGVVDMVDLSGDVLNHAKEDGSEVNSFSTGATQYLDVNNAKTGLSNSEIRCALA